MLTEDANRRLVDDDLPVVLNHLKLSMTITGMRLRQPVFQRLREILAAYIARK